MKLSNFLFHGSKLAVSTTGHQTSQENDQGLGGRICQENQWVVLLSAQLPPDSHRELLAEQPCGIWLLTAVDRIPLG